MATAYIAAGGLVSVLQLFDLLETILVAIRAEDLPSGWATVAGLTLAIIGGVQVWLRSVTKQPLGSASSESPAEDVEVETE